ncbi:MAG: hypothetical protein Kow0059_04190 [Candidatus Sumerlaeia bacterium]
MRLTITLTCLLAAGVLNGAPAQKEDIVSTIFKKDGTTIEGKIVKEHTDYYVIEVEGKNQTVDKADITRIARADNYAPILTEAYELESAGKYGEAMEKYHAILIKDPEHAEARAGKERMMQAIPYEFKKRYALYYKTGSYDKLLQFAYNDMSGVPADSPQREAMKTVESEIYTFMGQENVKQRKFDLAESDFKRALQLNPANTTAALMMGDLLVANQRWEEAYALLEKVVAAAPEHLIASGLFMQACLHAGKTDQGLAVYERLSARRDMTAQEAKFFSLCVDECRTYLAEAMRLRADTLERDGHTSAALALRRRAETIAAQTPAVTIEINSDKP